VGVAAVKHAAVIGAGIVGLSAADELLDRGFQVTVIERDKQEGEGCSFGNGGLIVPSHFIPLAAPGMVRMGVRMMLDKGSPFGVASFTDLQTLSWMARFALAGTKSHVERCAPLLRDLNLASRAIYESNVPEMSPEVGYERKGLIMLSATHAAHESETKLAEQANVIGLKATPLSREEVVAMEPGVDMEIAGGVHFEDDAHLAPDAYMRALRKRVTDKGATIRSGVEAKAFARNNGWIGSVETSAGPIEADEFVLAGGAWSADLAHTAGLRMPMRAGRGYGQTVTNPPQKMRIPTILTEARVAVTPVPTGVHFVGTLELTAPALRPSSPRVEAMRRNISRYYPAFTAETLEGPVWCGLRPCSPDGMPYLGRTARAQNLIVATGHAMMGMSLGPISGRLVAQLAAGDSPSIPLALLSPDRYD